MFCFDTNIWSHLIRRPPLPLVERLKACRNDEICLPELVRAELLFGVRRSARREELTRVIEKLLAPYRRIAFGPEAAEHYAEIRFELEQAGTPIGANDLIIAATARAAGATLVTANVREFSRVSGLRCEDWTIS